MPDYLEGYWIESIKLSYVGLDACLSICFSCPGKQNTTVNNFYSEGFPLIDSLTSCIGRRILKMEFVGGQARAYYAEDAYISIGDI